MKTPTYYPLIHNEWVKTYKSIKVKNPYSNDTVAKVYLADGDFLDMAIESAQKGLQVTRNLSGYERYQLLMNLVRELEKNEKDFIYTIIHENGKPIRFARNEVERAKLTFTWAAEEARRLNGGPRATMNPSPRVTAEVPSGSINSGSSTRLASESASRASAQAAGSPIASESATVTVAYASEMPIAVVGGT